VRCKVGFCPGHLVGGWCSPRRKRGGWQWRSRWGFCHFGAGLCRGIPGISRVRSFHFVLLFLDMVPHVASLKLIGLEFLIEKTTCANKLLK
jgi:hypothetical protein